MTARKSDNERQRYYWYWIIFSIIGSVIILLYILSKTIWSDHKWISEAIGIFGSLASLAGIVFALIQIKKADEQIVNVSQITEKTQAAVLDNRKEIRNFLTFSDIGHLIEQIKNTQNYVISNDLKFAVNLMKGIKDDLIRIYSQLKTSSVETDIDLLPHIQAIGIDISSITNHITQPQNTKQTNSLKTRMIHDNLEKAREKCIEIETILKIEKV